MFSKILIKLIDEAIVPAVTLITVRLASVILISRYLGIPFSLTNNGLAFNTASEYVKINSYSMAAMIISLVVGLAYTLTKSFFFHSSHITPKLTAQIFSLKLSFFIQNSFELYSQGAIWISYLFLLLLAAGTMVIFGLIYPWVAYLGLGTGILAAILFILDIEREINIQKLEDEKFDYYEDEEVVLEFGEDYV